MTGGDSGKVLEKSVSILMLCGFAMDWQSKEKFILHTDVPQAWRERNELLQEKEARTG